MWKKVDRFALLRFIQAFIDRNHYPPTFEDMRLGMGWGSKSAVYYRLKTYEAQGYIKRDHGKARSITIIREAADGRKIDS